MDCLDKTSILKKLKKVIIESSAVLSSFAVDPLKLEGNVKTNVDVLINDFLEENLPNVIDVPILSEEDFSHFREKSNLCWIVDPIDGTLNLLSGSPDIVISATLTDQNFVPLLSVVYLPSFRITYSAILGQGAWINEDKLIQTKPTVKILSYGLTYDAQLTSDALLENITWAIKYKYILRQSGSAALDICRVAKGTWIGFFEKSLFIWDVLAADLIAKESGCVSKIEYLDEKFRCNYIVASSKEKLSEMIQKLHW